MLLPVAWPLAEDVLVDHDFRDAEPRARAESGQCAAAFGGAHGVSDDRVVHVLTSRILDKFSRTVLHCHDGGEALELARRVLPDLVITDALLPTLDGRELARTLKQSPETSGCKVAVMTGLYKGQRYRAEAIRDFLVDEYLEKPIDPVRLRALVASVEVNAAPLAVAG